MRICRFVDFQRREIRRFFTGKLVCCEAVIVTVVVTAIIVFKIIIGMTPFHFDGSYC